MPPEDVLVEIVDEDGRILVCRLVLRRVEEPFDDLLLGDPGEQIVDQSTDAGSGARWRNSS